MEHEQLLKKPSRVFIVPYKNRPQHKFFFCKYMQFLLEDFDDYEIYFSHQCDDRVFNRGAVKNLGFLAVKEKYPDHYKNMTFIFNDVDTMPFNKIFSYHTTPGTVAHYYGFKHTLGGIVVIKGSDFERINGFPNIWGWGQEDNCLQYRCSKFKITIDRSVFYPIGSSQILQLFDGISRIINNTDSKTKTLSDDRDGISTLSNINWSIDRTSTDVKDNQFTVSSFDNNVYYINTTNFSTFTPYNINSFLLQDLRTKIKPKNKTNNDHMKLQQQHHPQRQQQQQQHHHPQRQQQQQHHHPQRQQQQQQHHHPQRQQQHQHNQHQMIKNANNWSIIPDKY
jgi:hypothetical protein